jgi:hypothetical protein
MSVAFSRASGQTVHFVPDEPPIHWPSAVVGLVLAMAVVVGVSWFASLRRPDVRVAGHVATVAAEAEPVVAPVVTPIPPPVATPAPVAERVRVANTRGVGVNLRAAAGERAGRIKTLAEGVLLELVGPDQPVDGVVWRNVRDPNGAVGWVSASFVAPSGR